MENDKMENDKMESGKVENSALEYDRILDRITELELEFEDKEIEIKTIINRPMENGVLFMDYQRVKELCDQIIVTLCMIAELEGLLGEPEPVF